MGGMKENLQILTTGDDNFNNHRGDFITCPECDNSFPTTEWDKNATTLVLEPWCIKASSVVVISECPHCSFRSWVHEPMDSFGYHTWPDEWKEAVKKHAANLQQKAIRKWNKDKCKSCSLLETKLVDYKSWRSCYRGIGPSENKCSEYKPNIKRKGRKLLDIDFLSAIMGGMKGE